MMEYTLKSSGIQTADAVICARPCRVLSVTLVGVSATAAVFDNATAASGTVVAKVQNGATNSNTIVWQSAVGVECLNGAYLDVTGTCEVIVHFALL